jgi:hypothetical protein
VGNVYRRLRACGLRNAAKEVGVIDKDANCGNCTDFRAEGVGYCTRFNVVTHDDEWPCDEHTMKEENPDAS